MADEVKPEQKPDAILCPQQYPPGMEDAQRHLWRNKHFGPILGAKRVWSSHYMDGRSFVRADPTAHATVNQTYDHPQAGSPRYEWTEPDKNGIQYGTLIPEPNEPEEPEPNA